MESSQTRDQTCVTCIGRRIPSHSTTREVLHPLFFPPVQFKFLRIELKSLFVCAFFSCLFLLFLKNIGEQTIQHSLVNVEDTCPVTKHLHSSCLCAARDKHEKQAAATTGLVAQSCPTLFEPTDCSPPSSSVHGDSPGKYTGVGCHFLL